MSRTHGLALFRTLVVGKGIYIYVQNSERVKVEESIGKVRKG